MIIKDFDSISKDLEVKEAIGFLVGFSAFDSVKTENGEVTPQFWSHYLLPLMQLSVNRGLKSAGGRFE